MPTEPRPDVPAARTLPALIRDVARATPDAPALVAGPTRWSYADLDAAVNRAAARLAALGVGADSHVGLLATNTAQWPAVALGALRLGARVDAFHTWVKAFDLDHLLAASGCDVLVMTPTVRSADLLGELRKLVPEIDEPGGAETDGWRSERFPALRHVALLDTDPDTDTGADAPAPAGAVRLRDVPADVPAPEVDADGDAPAFVLYTSGSTSAPKAVPLCHRDLVLNGFHIGERMGLGPDDRVWLGSPLFWSFGSANALMTTVTHGACLVLQEQFDPAAAVELFTAEQVTAAYLLPSLVDALLPVADRVRAVDSLRTGLTIGRPDEVRRAAEDLGVTGICNVYGSTEVYGNCCVTPHDLPLEERLVSQGPPLPGVELRVVDAEGVAHTADVTGEVQVRGRVMPGYLGAPEATAAVMTGDGWFRTGDELLLRADGLVEYRSRLTEMIKTSGINVSPAEVESYLTRHEKVRTATVVGAPHPSRGEVVVAFVVPTEPGAVDPDALRAWCKEGIAGYKVPWRIEVVDELPVTATGKLSRRALVESAERLVATGG